MEGALEVIGGSIAGEPLDGASLSLVPYPDPGGLRPPLDPRDEEGRGAEVASLRGVTPYPDPGGLRPPLDPRDEEGRGAGEAPTEAWEPAGYDIVAMVEFADGPLRLEGRLPLAVDLERDWTEWETGPLDLGLSGGVPLGVVALVDPDIRSAEGFLAVDGHIAGTLAKPSPAARVSLTDGELTHTGLGLVAEGISVAIQAAPSGVVVHRLALTPRPLRRTRVPALDLGADPRVEVHGTADLDPVGFGLGQVDLDVTLSHGPWLVATPDLTLRADGSLSFDGPWPALAVRGDLRAGAGARRVGRRAAVRGHDPRPRSPDPGRAQRPHRHPAPRARGATAVRRLRRRRRSAPAAQPRAGGDHAVHRRLRLAGGYRQPDGSVDPPRRGRDRGPG